MSNRVAGCPQIAGDSHAITDPSKNSGDSAPQAFGHGKQKANTKLYSGRGRRAGIVS
jgi:hypothetical protein